MGVEYLRQFKPFVKEAFQQTLRVGTFLCCIHVTNTYLCTFTYAWGPSMLPTLNLTGTLLLAERLLFNFISVVPKGHIWIEGDNKYNSSDSRNFGPVPYGLLEGRLFWKVWPLKEFGSLD
ncbi:hypothetical protein Leryth_018704 [Lithospermum erythrorhizon]|nr:hypothetical protein Leryth_018704 [Lithospermum erythrorhizon]